MSPADFMRSLAKAHPPAGLPPALTASWWAGKDNWTKAHEIVMDEPDGTCAWVHGYLHRSEGDHANAAYWYRKAGREAGRGPFEAEWSAIAAALLTPGRH
jgi:hypothetical protein